MTRLKARWADADPEAGATLIEVLMTIVITGIVLAALTGGIMTYMRAANATSALLSETGELQVTAAHFTTDVQSAETVAAPGAAVCDTTPAGGGTPLLDLNWRDWATATGSPQTVMISYFFLNTTNEVRRVECRDGIVKANSLLSHIQPGQVPQVLCDGSTTCPSRPRQIDLSVSVCTVDPSGACRNTPIPAKFTGVRRLSP